MSTKIDTHTDVTSVSLTCGTTNLYCYRLNLQYLWFNKQGGKPFSIMKTSEQGFYHSLHSLY